MAARRKHVRRAPPPAGAAFLLAGFFDGGNKYCVAAITADDYHQRHDFSWRRRVGRGGVIDLVAYIHDRQRAISGGGEKERHSGSGWGAVGISGSNCQCNPGGNLLFRGLSTGRRHGKDRILGCDFDFSQHGGGGADHARFSRFGGYDFGQRTVCKQSRRFDDWAAAVAGRKK